MSGIVIEGKTANERAHNLLDHILSIGRAVRHNYIIDEYIEDADPYDVFYIEFGLTILLSRLEKEGVLRKITMPEGILWGVVKTEFELND